MTFNESNFLIIVLIFSFCILNISAPYNAGSSSRTLDIDLNAPPPVEPNYDNMAIGPGSLAAQCLRRISRQCDVSWENVTKEICVTEGVRNFPYGEIGPDVEEYFRSFEKFLIAGNFPLPNQFCFSEAYKRSNMANKIGMLTLQQKIIARDTKGLKLRNFNNTLERCRRALMDFGAKSGTVKNVINDDEFSLGQTHQQYRQDILQYAFYQAKLVCLAWNSYTKAYLNEIAKFVTVSNEMESPQKFCLKKSLGH